VASHEVEVVFVDGDTGAQVGRARLSRDQVPESFGTHTTVALGATTWLVEHAETSSAADVAAGRRLVLTVRRVDAVPPADILYSLPTICDVLPASAGGAGIDRLEFHEDDWRQVEMVSGSLLDVVAGELHAIRAVYEGRARRDASGGPSRFTGSLTAITLRSSGCAVSCPELARRPRWSRRSGRRWMSSTSSSSTGAGAPSSTRARLLTIWPRYDFALAGGCPPWNRPGSPRQTRRIADYERLARRSPGRATAHRSSTGVPVHRTPGIGGL
jgi:hypothetical protein